MNALLWPFRMGWYLLWLAKEIITGSWDVLSNVFVPGPYGAPMIVELPLRCVTDMEITMMASSITITPGTLVVATAAGTRDTPPTLFVHALFGDSEDDTLEGLYDMEDRLLRGMRGRAPGSRPGALAEGLNGGASGSLPGATETPNGGVPGTSPGATETPNGGAS